MAKKKITIKEMAEQTLRDLKELKNETDIESSHCSADYYLTEFLLRLGYKDIVKAYDDLDKWYG